MDVYPNPFLEKKGVTTTSGIIVTGLPGIGKSYFLRVLLHLRTAAGLPTLYIYHSLAAALLWMDGKGYTINIENIDDAIFRQLLPKDTWCLVDSNLDVSSVPQNLIDSGLFIIQAASPRAHRTQWVRKVVSLTNYFVMKPWDCGELIAACQCQDDYTNRILTEPQLANFHNLYGGSARDAFSYADRTNDLEDRIKGALNHIQTSSIQAALTLQPTSIPSSTSHLLLSFFPISDRKRTVWKVDSSSQYLRDRLLSRIDENYERARQKWFYYLLRSRCPGSQAVAARMFDGFYHKHIIRGGFWTLRRMVASPTPQSEKQTWRTVEEAPKVLVAHKEIRVADRKPSSILVSSVQERTFLEWPTHEPLSVGIYYHPTHRKFATFDSFFVDEIGHAIVFQAGISRRHLSGKAWLEERGIRKVTYVYVTPERDQDEVLLPLEVDAFYDSVYCMHLEYEGDLEL